MRLWYVRIGFVMVSVLLLGTAIPAADVYAQAAGAVANGVPEELSLEVGSEAAPEGAVEQPVEMNEIAKILEEGRVNDVSFKDVEALKTFYEERKYKTAWVNNSLFAQLTPSQKQTEAIIKVLEEAWKHGLNPSSYNIAAIKELLGSNTLPFSKSNAPILDVLISDSLVRYVQDITGMRVAAKDLSLSSRYWREPMEGVSILRQVKSAGDVVSALASFSPQGALYRAMQLELERLYRTPVTAEETLVKFSDILRPGSSKEGVLALRKRMGFEADSTVSAHFVYDDALAQSVMAFQRAHGLKPDGIIGNQTLSVMNKTRDDRINQVLVNMERLRWLDQEKPDRYVVVNVPAARLWAIEEGKIAFDMKVIVGRYKRQTNIFNTEITGVRFNPTWTVPPTIKEEDFLPELQNDPMYLANRGIEVMHSGGTVDPTMVDWTAVSYNDLHGIQMVQQPGRSNPLGRVRVLMSNPYNIYLHDTNKRSYFDRSNRALSSGCVRMEDAEKLAFFVMKNNEGWSEDKMNRILVSGKKTDIFADVTVPVYLLYQTIWFGDNGQLVYGHDIYDRDIVLRRALHDIDGVGYPEVMSVSAPSIPKVPKRIYAAKRVVKAQKKKEKIQSESAPNAAKRGSLVISGGNKFKSKRKDGIDLLTFNE